jgi:hypothetical protein
MQGSRTDEDKRAEFRARYLYSGNASKSAREVGIGEWVGRKIARELDEAPDFTEELQALHAHAMRKHITLRMRVAEVAADKFEEELVVPEHVAAGASVTIIDKRPDYGRLVLESEKNAQNWARFQAERSGEVTGSRDVIISIAGPEGTSAKADGD